MKKHKKQKQKAVNYDDVVDRAVETARQYPIAVGDVVGHDSVNDFSGDVLDIVGGVALVDFGSGMVVRLPASECFDVNLVRHLALAEVQGLTVRDVAADHERIREKLRADKRREARANRHRLS